MPVLGEFWRHISQGILETHILGRVGDTYLGEFWRHISRGVLETHISEIWKWMFRGELEVSVLGDLEVDVQGRVGDTHLRESWMSLFSESWRHNISEDWKVVKCSKRIPPVLPEHRYHSC